MKLDLSNRGLSVIDSNDYSNWNEVTEFIVFNNELRSLPELPPTLKKLDCSENKLSSLPELPPTLIELYCGNNESFFNAIIFKFLISYSRYFYPICNV